MPLQWYFKHVRSKNSASSNRRNTKLNLIRFRVIIPVCKACLMVLVQKGYEGVSPPTAPQESGWRRELLVHGHQLLDNRITRLSPRGIFLMRSTWYPTTRQTFSGKRERPKYLRCPRAGDIVFQECYEGVSPPNAPQERKKKKAKLFKLPVNSRHCFRTTEQRRLRNDCRGDAAGAPHQGP